MRKELRERARESERGGERLLGHDEHFENSYNNRHLSLLLERQQHRKHYVIIYLLQHVSAVCIGLLQSESQ